MKHKVSELKGWHLDAAVAIAEGYVPDSRGYKFHKPPKVFHGVSVEWYVLPGDDRDEGGYAYSHGFHPSGNQDKGGEIIDREGIATWRSGTGWAAACGTQQVGWYDVELGSIDAGAGEGLLGPTRLIAAMRAYVASKLGDEVELP